MTAILETSIGKTHIFIGECVTIMFACDDILYTEQRCFRIIFVLLCQKDTESTFENNFAKFFKAASY